MNNGVLTLRMPKAAPKAGKKTISVQASQQGNGQSQSVSSGQSASSGKTGGQQSTASQQSTSSQSRQ